MIPDNQTNYLYLADSLPKKQPVFYKRFENLLSTCHINYALLSGTKDIWAVDYMPIQINKSNFVQFVYNPSYLQTQKLLKTISNVDMICETMGLKVHKSPILLDGGNVVKAHDKVIISTRVFSENHSIPKKELIKQLYETFEVDTLIFIPADPDDFTGHADGMVRFLDDKTVLVNDYSEEKSDFKYNFYTALHNAGLEMIEIPYNPYGNKNGDQANGIYINYLQMKDFIIVPIFNQKEDESVVKLFENIFNNLTINTIECNEIAAQGGILNCITWNVKQSINSPFRGLGGL